MANNKLILRRLTSPWTYPTSDITKSSVLTHDDVDNNFIYLKGELIYSARTAGTNLILDKINSSNITVDLSSLITAGDTFVSGATIQTGITGDTLVLTRTDGGIVTTSLVGVSGAFTHTASGIITPTNVFGNTNTSDYSSILGGSGNTISTGFTHSVIGGGNSNIFPLFTPTLPYGGIYQVDLNRNNNTIGGGLTNTLSSFDSTIGGGKDNIIGKGFTYIYSYGPYTYTNIYGGYNSVGGGRNNTIGDYTRNATIGGGQSNRIGTIGNTKLLGGFHNTIGGGSSNLLYGSAGPGTGNVVSGGFSNKIIDSNSTTIGGGNNNIINNAGGSVVLGLSNKIIDSTYSIALGVSNKIYNNSTNSTISGGKLNRIDSGSTYSSIGGGRGNTITHSNSHIIGSNVTSISANTTHVEKLNIGTLNGTAINVGLGLDVNGMVVSGDTSATFTGNTSGDCITDIFVSNIRSCSPLNINPSDEGDVFFGGNGALTLKINTTGATGSWLGINTTVPNYPLHVHGDAQFSNGSVAIGESPDPTHKLRVTTSDSDGINMTGFRVDMSHQAVKAVGNGMANFSGIQVRSVPDKTSTGRTQQWGIQSNMTSAVSTTGNHLVIAGRFVAKSANADNYAIQIEDGNEAAGRVLVCQPTSLYGQLGLARWESVTSLPGVSGDTFISGMTFNSGTYDLTIDRNDGASFTQSLSILATDMVVTGGTYDVNTGVVTFTNNSGGTFGVSGFTSGMTDSYTTTATTSGTEIQFTKNIGGGYTVDLDSMIATDISNTYFVTPTGNDTTGVRGNLHKPFKTITGARNKVVAELSASTISGDTLIHVYPGEYVEDEIQYENGNFYFEAGAVIKPPVRGGLTPVFNLGATLTLQPNIYTADTCNVYGNVVIELQSANSNGVGLFARTTSVSVFEFDKMYCGNGYGLAIFDNSKVIAKGNEMFSETNQYTITTRNSAESYLDIDRIYATSTFTFDWRAFDGVSYLKSSEITCDSNTTALFTDSITDGGVVVSDVGVINHQTTGSTYLIQNNLQNGGKITHNVSSITTSGASGGGFKTSNSSGGECNINGDIKTESTAILLNSTNSIGYSFLYDGNIQTTNPTAAIDLDDGTVRLNGSLNGLGTTTNGVDVASTVDLTVNNFIIENVSGDSITGTGSVDILNSLYIDKDLSVSRTGQYIFTGTTYTERLNVGTLNGTAINVGLGLDINGMVVSGETGGSTNKYAASITFTGGTPQTITHNLGSEDVQVQLKDSTGARTIEDVTDTYTSNTVDITVSITGTYRVIIIG